jgi:hypothetical protein
MCINNNKNNGFTEYEQAINFEKAVIVAKVPKESFAELRVAFQVLSLEIRESVYVQAYREKAPVYVLL